jgi:hypothetical protein
VAAAVPSPYGFWIRGVEPRDITWHLAPVDLRRAFWDRVAAQAWRLYHAQLKAGKDRFGEPMAPISAATAQARAADINPVTGSKPYSPMGKARASRPPLTPCGIKSRTLSLLKTKTFDDGVYIFWGRDGFTGRDWGEILDRHRRGYRQQFVYPTHSIGNVPSRDVFGLSPVNTRYLQHVMSAWWKLEYRTRTERDQQNLAAELQVTLPKPAPETAAQPARFRPGAKPHGKLGHEIGVDLDLAVFHSGSRARVEAAAAAGRFSGFRTSFGPRHSIFRQGGGGAPTAPPPGPRPTPRTPTPAAPVPRPAPAPVRPIKPIRPVRPKPQPGQPKGAPVSQAMEVQFHPQRPEIEAALRTIDRVHGAAPLPKIRVGLYVPENTLDRRQAVYSSEDVPSGRPVSIDVRGNAEHLRFALVHEVAHLLDDAGIPGGAVERAGAFRDFTADPLMRRFVKSVRESKAYGDLRTIARSKPVLEDPDDDTRKLLAYYLDWREVWARSYAQYIALKGADPVLADQLDKIVKQIRRDGIFPVQWDHRDFEPVAATIDDLFRKLGWRT